MNPFLVYALLAKATMTTFSGLSGVPIVRQDFVVHYRAISDLQLAAAVAAGRTAPGPNGSYIVSVGYFAAGIPGAIAGCLAVMTPAFLIIPLLRFLGRRAEQPRVKSAIQAVTLAAAGLILNATVPLARESVTNWAGVVIVAASFAAIAFTRVSTIWVMIAAALAGTLAR